MQITREALTKALNRKRFAWVDQVMREELPVDIYGAMHSDLISERMRATCWLQEQGYRVCDLSDGMVRVSKGTKTIREAKLVLELNDPEVMLAVMEQVNNANIPPPPWQPKNE